MIDATRIPVILQGNYGYGYILQKMNSTFQYGEIHIIAQLVAHFTRNDFTFQHGEIHMKSRCHRPDSLIFLYIPVWRDSYNILKRFSERILYIPIWRDLYAKKLAFQRPPGPLHSNMERFVLFHTVFLISFHLLYIPTWRGSDAAYIIIMRLISRFLVKKHKKQENAAIIT